MKKTKSRQENLEEKSRRTYTFRCHDTYKAVRIKMVWHWHIIDKELIELIIIQK